MEKSSDIEEGQTVGLEEPPPLYCADDEPPPSYDSLFGRIKAAKANSSGKADFMKNSLGIMCGTVGCTILIGLIVVIPVSMIAVGAMYLHDCTIERYIPIYLIVGGCFGILKTLGSLVQRVCNHKKNKEDDNAKPNPIDGLIGCFLFAWFIAGNVWIYRAHGSVNFEEDSSPQYCHPTLYLFAFWITTVMYILPALICCGVCCIGILGACCTRN